MSNDIANSSVVIINKPGHTRSSGCHSGILKFQIFHDAAAAQAAKQTGTSRCIPGKGITLEVQVSIERFRVRTSITTGSGTRDII